MAGETGIFNFYILIFDLSRAASGPLNVSCNAFQEAIFHIVVSCIAT
jgi:hypothetical protein